CGTATRTMSHPAAVSSAICCSVALMLVVCVVVIDCTLTCESLPTPTLPTVIWRVLRRGASTGGVAGIPKLIAATRQAYLRALGIGRTATTGLRSADDRQQFP